MHSKEHQHRSQGSSRPGYGPSATMFASVKAESSLLSSSSAAGSARVPLPNARLPVRLVLSDPRVNSYLLSNKFAQHSAHSSSRQHDLAPGSSCPQSIPVPASAPAPTTASGGAYVAPRRECEVNTVSPIPFPSPAPSMPSVSPEFHVPCDFHAVGYQKHTRDDRSGQLSHERQRLHHNQQPQRTQQRQRQPDLSSPPTSEVDPMSESKTLPPLFRASPPPQYNGRSHSSSHPGTHLLLPSSRTNLGPVQLANSLSASSNAFSGSSRASYGLFNPATDSRAVSPPLSNQAWSSKHHHPKIPIRSPERAGQELMMTSTTDTDSSAYMNMDYYNIYRQNPLLLRPQGGRYDERRHSTSSHPEDSVPGPVPNHAHFDTYSGSKGKARASSTGCGRRHSQSLLSTATYRVLRHEDAKEEMDTSQEIVRSLGIQSAAAKARSSTSARPFSMSIQHLLTDDDSSGYYQFHSSSSSSSYGSEDSAATGGKRKMSSMSALDGNDQPKYRRMSKKRAAELGLLDEDGNIMRKRKRTKKVQDPDHVSPNGFRHGGERTVQEPEELVELDPDVGPTSVLDRIPRPTVYWRGQPLSVVGKPGYELLHPYETYIASTLRLSPAQYLSCKRTLILTSRAYYAKPDGKQFRKSDAQKLCRIDVNKTSRLWEVFAKVGWLEGISERDI
ncbi:hypothetical protein BGZ54_001304 [Gamsiella multidivaricata]|nr:hypothetical protein BGZ54_001304 [Gamsiella multidivaricata]